MAINQTMATVRRKRGNAFKSKQLGMPFGTAMGRLRKAIMFDLVSRLGENICYRCKKEIKTVNEFSIEHKKSWQTAAKPIIAFFSLKNISFSHHLCNIIAGRQDNKRFKSPKENKHFHNSRRTYKTRKSEYAPAKRRARYLRTGN